VVEIGWDDAKTSASTTCFRVISDFQIADFRLSRTAWGNARSDNTVVIRWRVFARESIDEQESMTLAFGEPNSRNFEQIHASPMGTRARFAGHGLGML
jgi:hypothetical protein